jgi:hypothetical protein
MGSRAILGVDKTAAGAILEGGVGILPIIFRLKRWACTCGAREEINPTLPISLSKVEEGAEQSTEVTCRSLSLLEQLFTNE